MNRENPQLASNVSTLRCVLRFFPNGPSQTDFVDIAGELELVEATLGSHDLWLGVVDITPESGVYVELSQRSHLNACVVMLADGREGFASIVNGKMSGNQFSLGITGQTALA